MQLNIKYFGLLAEVTQCSEETLEFLGTTVSELRNTLQLKHEDLEHKNYHVAQNNELVSNETIISETKIALLPPFAGG